MDRREFFKTSAVLAGATLLGVEAQAGCSTDFCRLSFSRNKGKMNYTDPDEAARWPSKVLFYNSEMPSVENQKKIIGIFDAEDAHQEWDSKVNGPDVPFHLWQDDGHRFKLSDLETALQGKPFTWLAWYQPVTGSGQGRGWLNLLTSGHAPGRFEYLNNKVCMFERWMYSGGDTQGRDRFGHVNFDGHKMMVWCNMYWTTTLATGCVVRWKYKIADGCF